MSHSSSALLEAALNGARTSEEHPAIPRTPDEIAAAGHLAVEAGAQVLHIHAYDPYGHETLAAPYCAAVLTAMRQACPGVSISLTTSSGVEPDPARRLQLVGGWIDLPDLVTANMGEPEIAELCALLLERGVGIEAGLLTLDDARKFIVSGLAARCTRVLIEPLDESPATAVAHAAEMERVIISAGIDLEQVHHGDGIASWAVNRRAVERGYGIRTGLEDTVVLPDGRLANDNAELVRVAAAMLASKQPR